MEQNSLMTEEEFSTWIAILDDENDKILETRELQPDEEIEYHRKVYIQSKKVNGSMLKF